MEDTMTSFNFANLKKIRFYVHDLALIVGIGGLGNYKTMEREDKYNDKEFTDVLSAVNKLKGVHQIVVDKYDELEVTHKTFVDKYQPLEATHKTLVDKYNQLEVTHSGCREAFEKEMVKLSELSDSYDLMVSVCTCGAKGAKRPPPAPPGAFD